MQDYIKMSRETLFAGYAPAGCHTITGICFTENVLADPTDEFSSCGLEESRKLLKQCDSAYTKLLARKEKMVAKK